MSKSTDFDFGWNVTGASDRDGASDEQGELPTMAKQFKKLPFLKAEDVPASGQIEMKVLGNVRSFEGDYGLKLNMDVEIKGKKYSFGVKPTNPGLRVIINSLAERKVIKVERGEYNGNDYVKIVGSDFDRER
jgi:hypothetical protein